MPYSLNPSNPGDAAAVDDDNNNDNNNSIELSFLRS
jgi:hypothetical protein